VTTQAISHLCAVGLVVAGVALGHYGIVVSLFRIEDMERAVAFLTVESVFPPVIPYIAKYAWVALSALLHCQRLGLRAVKLRVRRYLYLHFSAALGGKSHGGHNAKDQNYCCKDMKLSYFHCTILLLKNWLLV